MKQHLNTLFVTTPRAALGKDGESAVVRVGRDVLLRVPLHHIGSIVTFGAVGVSPALMAACARAGISISLLSEHGSLLARIVGFTPGNVLLRREQYRRADSEEASVTIARSAVLAKVANARSALLRAARDRPTASGQPELVGAAGRLALALDELQRVDSLDGLRGIEGDAARNYFSVFNVMITAPDGQFRMNGRTRRPPLDPVNALLSFLYVLLAHDARSACEAAGLDPAVGFLHRDRPGRPGLALDLMEELRPFLVDRLALALINRRQIQASGFRRQPAGGFEMDDETRRSVLVAYQKRKQESVMHPFLQESVTIGLIIHLQARLLARYLRGELDAYPAFISHG